MYQHFGKAIVRKPLFPLTDLIVSREGEAAFEKLLFQRLNDPVFLESLYWASPDFYRQALAFREGKLLDAKKKERILHTLKKYIIRSSSRCTPYGIFAGCTMRYLVPENKILAGPNVERRRHARVDVGLLQAIIGNIERDDNIVPFLHYRINPSLYTIADSYRYMEAQLKDGRTHHQLSTIERTELLDEICYLARIEALSFTQLSDLIGYEESESDKQAFVKELLAMQFLVSDLAVQVLGDRQLDYLINRLRTIAESCSLMVPYLEVLLLFRETTLSIEQSPLGKFPVEKLESLALAIKQLGISWQGALLQVDLYGDSDNGLVLNDQSIKGLWSGVEALSRFTPKRSPAEEELRKFKKLFLERYEFQEVSLLEVLDAELGIGYPVTKGIGNIAYNAIINEELKGAGDFKKQGNQDEELWHSFLQKRCEQLFLDGQDELVLKDEDIKGFAPKTEELANTVSVICSFSASGACYIQHVGGSTANALLGRFSYLHPTVKELTDTIAQKEMQLDAGAVLAEIVCLPQGRVGNVLRRMEHYPYQINCFGTTLEEKERTIHLSDLLVSLQHDEIVIRSKKLNKRVIPRLSSAHNYSTTELPVYRFLAAIQHQAKPGLLLSWGAWANGKKFMPRVRYKQVILHRASWFFDEEDYKQVEQAENVLIAIKRLFAQWKVAKYVALGEGDHELFMNTQSDEYLSIFWNEWQRTKTIKLLEYLFLEPETAAGTKAQQFVIPFAKEDAVQPKETFIRPATSIAQRTFIPGSEWLYVKLYCGAFISDNILLQVVKQLGDDLLSRKHINQYFFVRYTDPHYHIRFRMHFANTSSTHYAVALAGLHKYCEPFVKAKLIWKVQLDTYVRELERYGEKQMAQSEELFFADTQVLLHLMAEEAVREDQLLRLRLGVKNLDNWLDLFNLPLTDRIMFTQQMIDSFTEEFGNKMKVKLQEQYRHTDWTQTRILHEHDFTALFATRQKALGNDVLLDNLASYIHMSLNRWFKADQRLMEFACYIYANKQYKNLQHTTG